MDTATRTKVEIALCVGNLSVADIAALSDLSQDEVEQVRASYRPEVYVADGSPKVWYTNALRGTAEEMEEAAKRTFSNWFLCAGWRVVPVTTPKQQPVKDEHLNRVFLEVPE